MKKILIIMIAVVGAFSLTCCDNKLGTDQVDAGYISIRASIGQMTKVAYNGSATSFTEGDTILLYGWTGSADEIPSQRVVDSVTNWFDGTVWIPTIQMRWKNATDSHYFLGIYPVPDSVTNLTVADYKLDVTDYRSSDLLVAANLGGIKATDGPVNLTFNHVLAKLNVNLKFPSEWDSVPVVNTVTATVKTTATVNYLTGTITANGIEEALAMHQDTITAAGYDYSFSCLEIPQPDAKYITITVGGRKFVYEASLGIPLNSGKFTTIDLMVGKDTIVLNTVSVSEWETATDIPGGVAELDPYNGHEYVDLGLPSGLKWAACNIGASKPEEYGDYFVWGDIVPYYSSQEPLIWEKGKEDGYVWSTYKWCNGSFNTLTKYCNLSNYGNNNYTDTQTTLDVEDDAARYQWGGPWRMPTKADFEELVSTQKNTDDYTWTWRDGGWQIVRISTGATLFLPAAGHRKDTDLIDVGDFGFYWSSSLNTDFPYDSWFVIFASHFVNCSINIRTFGFSVRPVAN